jgi:hypothetical protein
MPNPDFRNTPALYASKHGWLIYGVRLATHGKIISPSTFGSLPGRGIIGHRQQLIGEAQRKITQGSGRLMNDRIDCEIVCPNGHDQTVTFSHDQFEAELKSGALRFHCNTCDTDWAPFHDEIVTFRTQFSKNSG